MKNIIGCIVLSLCFHIGMAQNLIDSSEASISNYLVKKKGVQRSTIERGKKEDDNTPWLAYSEKDVKVVYFFNSKMICTYYRKIYPNVYYDKVMAEIKKKYTPTGEQIWENRTIKGKVYIVSVLNNDENYFIVDESPAK